MPIFYRFYVLNHPHLLHHPQPTVSLDVFQQQQAMLQSLQHLVDVLIERLSSVEDTCRIQAERLKCRHDDQDDPDHHEGEKRRRLSETETQTMESVHVETEGASGSGSPIVPKEWALIVDPYAVSDPTKEYANTERVLVVMQAEIDEILHPDYQPDVQPSVVLSLLTYPADHLDISQSNIPVTSPPD
ncbi:hypothetical protein L6452_05117 [Arctium lappa]|uniref:Uncharacterized protein n=1 Tax=Arctium lappa TaxID=4217 RepID=A0ACB9EFP8_ARCLA|nr:hypothetical protein L6452_05117 [Arctium lappa]